MSVSGRCTISDNVVCHKVVPSWVAVSGGNVLHKVVPISAIVLTWEGVNIGFKDIFQDSLIFGVLLEGSPFQVTFSTT